MSHSKKEREEYNQRRERVSKEFGIDKNSYNRLRRSAEGLTRADTNYANGTTGGEPKYSGNKIVNEYTEKNHRKDTDEAFKKIASMAKKMGLHYYHQSDPRGASLYVSKKRMSQENYNREGKHIY